MAKIVRFTGFYKAFAVSAIGLNRTVFGDTSQSDTLDNNMNAEYFEGWEIVTPSEFPSRQDFNAMGFALGQSIAYIHQQGIPEYDSLQEYFMHSRVIGSDGVEYSSKTNSNIGNDPLSDLTNWEQPIPPDIQTDLDSKVSLTGNQTVAGVKTFTSFLVTPSSAPTTDFQVANKQYVDDTAALTGYKNKLINGRKRINERGYAGGVLANNVYGYDRWKGADSDANIEQIIDTFNIEDGIHTISWTGGGTATVAGFSGLSSGDSVVLPGGNISVKVPKFANSIQLEEGSIATSFEVREKGLELSLCQRYFEKQIHASTFGWVFEFTSGLVGQFVYKNKRANPTFTFPVLGLFSDSSFSGVISSFALSKITSASCKFTATTTLAPPTDTMLTGDFTVFIDSEIY